MIRITCVPIIFIFIIVLSATLTSWGQELDVIIRDFKADYYGFEEKDYNKHGTSKECDSTGATKGMVQDKLDYSQCSKEIQGKDSVERAKSGRYCARPMPANGKCYGKYLDTWYTDGAYAKTIKTTMPLTMSADSVYEVQYNESTCTNWNGIGDSPGYFPLDKYDNPDDPAYSPGATWGRETWASGYDQPNDGWNPPYNKNPTCKPTTSTYHNFGYTLAGSAEFKYVNANNDRFEFMGDDDMWVFIDGKLALDLGGVHNSENDTIIINDWAEKEKWEEGSMHAINFFYAERQTVESNLKLQFRLTGLSESQFGGPVIKKAETVISDGSETKTIIWVDKKLEEASLTKFITDNPSGEFPIIVRKFGDDRTVNGYKLISVKFLKADGANGYMYEIVGEVCESKNDAIYSSCKLSIGSGDSLSFNVMPNDVAGYNNGSNIALPQDTSWYIKSIYGIPAEKIVWGPNTTQMPPIAFVPVPGDNNPIKPPFDVQGWFTGNPTDEGCAGCGPLPSGGTFPLIWDSVPIPNYSVHGFGKVGTPIPPQRAGELILTAYPNPNGTVNVNGSPVPYSLWKDGQEYETARRLFGLPPEVSEFGPYGIADPKEQAYDGGYQFVKNGFPNESSVGSDGRIAPTRCLADRTDLEKPRINCLNFSLPAKQPFQLSVILYDQLGNFVTQYRETITEQEFRSVVQGPNYVAESNADKIQATSQCQKPTPKNYGKDSVLTTNGWVKVNVNIYPFSKDGRRFGNGVYIAKIDRVDLPYKGCMLQEGSTMPTYIEEDYVRYHADQKFGWMRSSPKK